jgi:predicted PurR-regulated permease PerM
MGWNRITLLLLTLIISLLFLSMIRHFLMTIFLAGIFSGMFQPVFEWFVRRTRGHRSLSSLLTLLVVCLMIIMPLFLLLGIVAGQAIQISNEVGPWIARRLEEPAAVSELFRWLPFHDYVLQYKGEILQRAGELVGRISTVLLESIQAVTLRTINVVLLFLVFLYMMFFFLKDGRLLLERILFYLPLTEKDEQRLLERFVSVTRATIKGSLIIGIIQGGLAGFGFWFVGIEGALFWGTVMIFLSIIPAVGSALVWLPATIILAATGQMAGAVILLVYCGLIVGTVDNLLRPRMVGRDVKMHEVLILISTLGGISMFGIIGFIIGPVVAALFVTVWDIYGETFREQLTGRG